MNTARRLSLSLSVSLSRAHACAAGREAAGDDPDVLAIVSGAMPLFIQLLMRRSVLIGCLYAGHAATYDSFFRQLLVQIAAG